MITVYPQSIKNADGKNSLVVLPAQEFEIIMKELEEMDNIRIYDEAKKDDSSEHILFSDYLKAKKQKNA